MALSDQLSLCLPPSAKHRGESDNELPTMAVQNGEQNVFKDSQGYELGCAGLGSFRNTAGCPPDSHGVGGLRRRDVHDDGSRSQPKIYLGFGLRSAIHLFQPGLSTCTFEVGIARDGTFLHLIVSGIFALFAAHRTNVSGHYHGSAAAGRVTLGRR